MSDKGDQRSHVQCALGERVPCQTDKNEKSYGVRSCNQAFHRIDRVSSREKLVLLSERIWKEEGTWK